MIQSSYAKKILSVVLSLTMLLSCMVWSGVSAADDPVTCDFTNYGVTSASDVDQSNGSKAQVVDTGEAGHGQAMKLYYEAGATTGSAGFRFFSGTDTKQTLDQCPDAPITPA